MTDVATPRSIADVHASLIAQHAEVTQELKDTKEGLTHLTEKRKKLHAELSELTRALAFYERLKNPKRRRRNAE